MRELPAGAPAAEGERLVVGDEAEFVQGPPVAAEEGEDTGSFEPLLKTIYVATGFASVRDKDVSLKDDWLTYVRNRWKVGFDWDAYRVFVEFELE